VTNISDTNNSQAEGLAPEKSDIAKKVEAGLARRYRAEARFKSYGIVAIGVAILMLITLFATVIGKGIGAFQQTYISLEVTLYPQDIDPEGTRDPKVLNVANYQKPINQAILDLFPEVKSRGDKRAVRGIVSKGAQYKIREMVLDNPDLIGQRLTLQVPVSDDYDMLAKWSRGIAGFPISRPHGSSDCKAVA
jgi:phosphate transport system permease protein